MTRHGRSSMVGLQCIPLSPAISKDSGSQLNPNAFQWAPVLYETEILVPHGGWGIAAGGLRLQGRRE